MPLSCAAFNCTNRYQKCISVTFHKFPLKNAPLLKKWLVAVKRGRWVPTNASRLCSDHFIPSDFRHVNDRTYLKDNIVPSQFDFSSLLKKKAPHTSSSPGKRKLFTIIDDDVHLESGEMNNSVDTSNSVPSDHDYYCLPNPRKMANGKGLVSSSSPSSPLVAMCESKCVSTLQYQSSSKKQTFYLKRHVNDRTYLKDNIVPSQFDFSSHLKKKAPRTRGSPGKRKLFTTIDDDVHLESGEINNSVDTSNFAPSDHDYYCLPNPRNMANGKGISECCYKGRAPRETLTARLMTQERLQDIEFVAVPMKQELVEEVEEVWIKEYEEPHVREESEEFSVQLKGDITIEEHSIAGREKSDDSGFTMW